MSGSQVYRLRGKVRHYQWGGREFIPRLLGSDPDGRPWAEYWLGAHPGDPAEAEVNGQWRPLDQLIADDPQRWLGSATANEFGQLPYLIKILDVARPLSIQVHPNRQQARAGFEREEAAGIALDDPQRNFKDPNHKPELALALSDFWVLYGFRPAIDIAADLSRFDSLKTLTPQLAGRSVKELFEHLMNADDQQLTQWLLPLFATIDRAAPMHTPDYWIAQWRDLHDSDEAAIDRGVFGFLLMNLLRLAPGESLFQDANVPHAYLRGQCVEIMANSDNVLRGGLTPKHVDPAALTTHIDFGVTGPPRSAPPAGFSEFQLSWVEAEAGQKVSVAGHGLSIMLVLEGSLDFAASQTLKTGEALVVADGPSSILTATAPAGLVVASPGAPTGTVQRQNSNLLQEQS